MQNKIVKKPKQTNLGAGGMVQVVENLPSKHEILSSTPQYHKTKQKHL
jgi:hypothetical protein